MDGEYKSWATSEHDTTNYKIGNIFGTEGWPGWHSGTFGSGPMLFGVELPSPIVLSHYKIQAPNVSYGLKRFFIEGSNDGMTWDELDYQDNYTNWVSHAYHTFIIPNPEHKAYKSFRWRVLSTNGGNHLQIYDLRLFGYQQTPIEFSGFVPSSPLNATINSANFNTRDKTLQVTGKVINGINHTISKVFATMQQDLTPDQVRTLLNDPTYAEAVYDFSEGAVMIPKVMGFNGEAVYDSSAMNYANVYLYGTDGVDINHDALTTTVVDETIGGLTYEFMNQIPLAEAPVSSGGYGTHYMTPTHTNDPVTVFEVGSFNTNDSTTWLHTTPNTQPLVFDLSNKYTEISFYVGIGKYETWGNGIEPRISGDGFRITIQLSNDNQSTWTYMKGKQDDTGSLIDINNRLISPAMTRFLRVDKFDLTGMTHMKILTSANGNTINDQIFFVNTSLLVTKIPNHHPYVTIPNSYWSRFYKQMYVDGTTFSSMANIEVVYAPMAFTADVDLTNVKDFFTTNGTVLANSDSEQYIVKQLGETILTHAYANIENPLEIVSPLTEHGDYQIVLAAKDVNGNVGVESFFKLVPFPSDIQEYPPVNLAMTDSGQRTIENYIIYSTMVSSGTYMDGEYKAWTNSENDTTSWSIRNVFGTENYPGWYSAHFTSPVILGIELPSPIVLLQYKLQVENSTEGFRRFFMEGSNDGMTWDELDYQDNYTSWVTKAYHTFVITNPTDKLYKSFRWRVLSTNGNTRLRMYDIKLFGYQKALTEFRSFVPLSPLNATISSANFNTNDKTLRVAGEVVVLTNGANPAIFKAFATVQQDLTPDQVRTMIKDPVNAAAVYDFSAGAVMVPKVLDITGAVYDSSAVNYANVYLYGTDGINEKHDALSNMVVDETVGGLTYEFMNQIPLAEEPVSSASYGTHYMIPRQINDLITVVEVGSFRTNDSTTWLHTTPNTQPLVFDLSNKYTQISFYVGIGKYDTPGGIEASLISNGFHITIQLSNNNKSTWTYMQGKLDDNGSLRDINNLLISPANTKFLRVNKFDLTGMTHMKISTGANGNTNKDQVFFVNTSVLVMNVPDLYPHVTIPNSYWSRFYKQVYVDGAAFSSVANIDSVYAPIAFTADVDLTNVMDFFKTNRTVLVNSDVERYAVKQLEETVLTHAYANIEDPTETMVITETGDYQVVLAAKDVVGNVSVGSFFKVVPVPSDLREYPPVGITMTDISQRTIENYILYSAIVSSGTYMDGEYKAWTNSENDTTTWSIRNAFNNEGYPGWYSNTIINPVILGLEIPSPIVLSKYKLQVRNANEGFKRFFMEGSNDGTTWDELDYQDNYTSWVSNAYHTFIITNPTDKAYNLFRWRVLSANGSSRVLMYDIRLFGYQNIPTEVHSFVPLSSLNTTISSANFNTNDKTLQLYGKVVPDATLPTKYYALATTNPNLTPDEVLLLKNTYPNAVVTGEAGTLTDLSIPKVIDLTGAVYDSSTVNYANVYLYGTDGVDLKHDALDKEVVTPRTENKVVYDFSSMTLTTATASGMTESSFVALSDNYYMVGDKGNGAKKYIYRIDETSPYQTITESLTWQLAMTDFYFICASASVYKVYYRNTSDVWTEFHSKTTGVVGEYESDIYDKTVVIQTSTGLDIITIVPGATQDDAPTVTTETITTKNSGCYNCRIYENTIIYVDNSTKIMHVWERLDSTSPWVEVKAFTNTMANSGVSLYKNTITRKENSPKTAKLHVYDRVNSTWNDRPSSTLTLPGTDYGKTTSMFEDYIIVGYAGPGDAALYKRGNRGVWETTHTAMDYGSNEPWDVKIQNNIILIGRSTSVYKYEGTIIVVPPELSPFVKITEVSVVTSGALTVSGTVFSSIANITDGVRVAVFDPGFNLEAADQSALASFVRGENGKDLGITSDKYVVGNFADVSLNGYYTDLTPESFTLGLVDDGTQYTVVVVVTDSLGNTGITIRG
jgi:hypothetical protein